jgi:hypothetical protein
MGNFGEKWGIALGVFTAQDAGWRRGEDDELDKLPLAESFR